MPWGPKVFPSGVLYYSPCALSSLKMTNLRIATMNLPISGGAKDGFATSNTHPPLTRPSGKPWAAALRIQVETHHPLAIHRQEASPSGFIGPPCPDGHGRAISYGRGCAAS